MANALAAESSPYLRQHADNPVDWLPWGPPALGLAVELDRPILLSIGYSACHWCHVMAHESFEDPDIATYLNQHFVCIKVDREERPDVDAVYMDAVQVMTGHGGWPLTAFLDTDARPFHCGTYFPPEPSRGLPSFRMILEAVVASWTSDRETLTTGAAQVTERIAAQPRPPAGEQLPGAADLELALAELIAEADPVDGGFGDRRGPKFPPASALELLLGRDRAAECELTLDAMAGGGIHDQLAGGFARYSVDGHWLVPHFEKMLYDNALLARAYLHGWQETGNERWRDVCRSTLDWMLAEMRAPGGGFHSALDADSEGVEGRFYVWSDSELREVLAEAGLAAEADAITAHWGVTAAGNFEGSNILNLPGGLGAPAPAGLERARHALLERRAERIRPGLDDKVICSWNAMAISALADAGAVLGEDRYLSAARGCAEFVLESMRDPSGRLIRSHPALAPSGFLEDHALMLEALICLYEATFEPRWIEEAGAIAGILLDRFEDRDRGGFHTTADDAEALIARRKDAGDHPHPSGNSAAALGLLRLAALTGERRWRQAAERTLLLFAPVALRHPASFAHTLRALDFAIGPAAEVAIVSPGPGDAGAAALTAQFRSRLRPRAVLAGGTERDAIPELLAGRRLIDGQAAAYVCEDFACSLPVTSPAELEGLLGA